MTKIIQNNKNMTTIHHKTNIKQQMRKREFIILNIDVNSPFSKIISVTETAITFLLLYIKYYNTEM